MRPDVHTLAGAYALDAVDDIERAEFDRHLAQCPACAHEVAELRTAAANLADLVAVAPPPRMRSAVLNEVRRTRQLRPRHRPPARVGQPRSWRLAVVAAAVSVIAAVGAGTYAVQELRVRNAQAQAAQASQIATVLGAADAHEYAVWVTGGGHVRLVESVTQNRCVAMLSDLPEPNKGQSYQLWVIRSGQAVNLGMVVTQSTDTRLVSDVTGADVFAVSLENSMTVVGSPSTDVVAKIPLR